jgi:dTDP-4-dehydrorhamnose reductase
MRLLVTGGSGQLGRAILEQPQGHTILAPSHGELDIADTEACRRAVRQAKPDWVLHCAALTDVDACERDPKLAHLLNAEAVLHVAEAARESGARMVMVSTDYVFDGARGHYREGDATTPLSHYGRSKLAGERLLTEALPAGVVARTSVLFGPHKNNFVRWVQASLRAGKAIRVVSDQWVTPTCTADAARQVLALVELGATGVWHTAGAESLSRLEMARRIARREGADERLLEPVRMADLQWLAPRPRDSSLDTTKIRSLVAPLGFDAALATLDGPSTGPQPA